MGIFFKIFTKETSFFKVHWQRKIAWQGINKWFLYKSASIELLLWKKYSSQQSCKWWNLMKTPFCTRCCTGTTGCLKWHQPSFFCRDNMILLVRPLSVHTIFDIVHEHDLVLVHSQFILYHFGGWVVNQTMEIFNKLSIQ